MSCLLYKINLKFKFEGTFVLSQVKWCSTFYSPRLSLDSIQSFFTFLWCSSLSQKVASNPIFQGDFHMEFCDNQRQLLQAYFRDFSVERLDRPWQAFTGSWSAAAVARNLGLNASFVGGRHSYVLVRLARHRAASRVTDDIQVGVHYIYEEISLKNCNIRPFIYTPKRVRTKHWSGWLENKDD